VRPSRPGARADRFPGSHPKRHAPHGAHPPLPAARRARPERGQHPARHPHRGAEPAPPRRGAAVNAAAPIYLDYAATTPVDAAVAVVMSECLMLAGSFGNPSSAHAFGRAAAPRVADARAQEGALIGASPEEIVFTSGATESNNLAILGVAAATAAPRPRLLTPRTEHKAVLDPCHHLQRHGAQITYLAPEASGALPPQ